MSEDLLDRKPKAARHGFARATRTFFRAYGRAAGWLKWRDDRWVKGYDATSPHGAKRIAPEERGRESR